MIKQVLVKPINVIGMTLEKTCFSIFSYFNNSIIFRA